MDEYGPMAARMSELARTMPGYISHKAFTAAALKSMPLFSNRFGIEPEITAKVARNRFRMFEVPINYNGRGYDEGKKINWKDGFRALYCILKYGFLRAS